MLKPFSRPGARSYIEPASRSIPSSARQLARPGDRRPVQRLRARLHVLAPAEHGPLLRAGRPARRPAPPPGGQGGRRWRGSDPYPRSRSVGWRLRALLLSLPIDWSVSLRITPSEDQESLPYRGTYGGRRPPGLSDLALPPDPMPSRQGSRPLKAWRYVGVYGPELMVCVASVRIGPARQAFWAVWDRTTGRLYERTVIGKGRVELSPGRARLTDREVEFDLTLEETDGVETVCASAGSYAWTRKQGGIPARGWISIDGRRRPVQSRAVIDDTAAYYQRHTAWRWSAGVGSRRRRTRAGLEPGPGRQRSAASQRAHAVDRRRAPRAGAGHLRRRPHQRRRACASAPKPPASRSRIWC